MGRTSSAVTFALFVATTSAGAQQALPVRDPLDDRAVLPAEEPQRADERLWATLRNGRPTEVRPRGSSGQCERGLSRTPLREASSSG